MERQCHIAAVQEHSADAKTLRHCKDTLSKAGWQSDFGPLDPEQLRAGGCGVLTTAPFEPVPIVPSTAECKEALKTGRLTGHWIEAGCENFLL